jgi:hypothetical protein
MKAANTQGNLFSTLKHLLHADLKSFFVVIYFICIGCAATTGYKTNPAPPNLPPNARVLLMPLDVQLFELTAGGLQEPKADWTTAAENHIHAALESFLQQKNDSVVLYKSPQNDPEKARINEQLMKLHETVGQSITVHTYFSAYNLPTKKDTFDWSLGEGVQRINERYDADCALFIFIRDSYATAGRKAAMVFGALAGFYVAGGLQMGFSSLVDLHNGNILWFGRLLRETGDLRTPEPAREAVLQLLAGIPL